MAEAITSLRTRSGVPDTHLQGDAAPVTVPEEVGPFYLEVAKESGGVVR